MEIRKNVLVEVTDEDIIDGKFAMPAGITNIYMRAFRDRKTLKSVDLSNITYIGAWAFDGCTSLPRPNEDIRKRIYNTALKYLKKYGGYGLCCSINSATYDIINKYKIALSAECVFPRFTYENAKKNFGANKNESNFWWPTREIEIRKEFLQWCYEDDISIMTRIKQLFRRLGYGRK